MCKLLNTIGFKYRKQEDKSYVYEQPLIIVHRHQYLRSIRQYRSEDRPIIYLDETWANSHDGHARMWVEDACQGSTSGGIRKPPGKGNRLIVLHTGSREGLVKDAALVFQGKRGTGDYCDEMNHNTLEEWVTNQLFPPGSLNIPPRSVIVMDNASYHSRQLEHAPTSNSHKAEMIEWLDKHSVCSLSR